MTLSLIWNKLWQQYNLEVLKDMGKGFPVSFFVLNKICLKTHTKKKQMEYVKWNKKAKKKKEKKLRRLEV